jgi:acetylornithine aminotransferase/acetylornithine/N-succinyldiaminopimelate aminotransferase
MSTQLENSQINHSPEQIQHSLEQIQAAEAKLLLPTYERNPILFTGGEGVYLVDEQGNKYLDLLSGIGVNALGYGHPAIELAIVEQSKKLLHISNLYYHPGQAEVALRLTEMSGLDRAFFCNSGTEAWEAAMKLARAYAGVLRSEGKEIGTKFLAMENSFHGRSYGSVSTTYKAKYREPFGPVVPGVEFVRFNDVDDLRAKFSSEVCAILLEPIQGEGGIRPVSAEFFAAARELTESTGALLVADEIQAGMGRTGEWFAYQHYGIQPDIVTVAKPLAGGLPLGAMLCTEAVSRAMHPGMHGTTFGGGPLACAVAIAVIDTIKSDDLLEHVTVVGTYFRKGLTALQAKHPAIVEVRGKGLMLAAELNSADLAKAVLAKLLERRILINRTDETVLRFLPPFIIERQHVDATIAAIDEILTQLEAAASQHAQEAATAIPGGR